MDVSDRRRCRRKSSAKRRAAASSDAWMLPGRTASVPPSARPLERPGDQNRQQMTGPTISMIVSKDIAWRDSSTPVLRGWCDLPAA